MTLKDKVLEKLGKVDPRIFDTLSKYAKSIPFVRNKLEGMYDNLLDGLEDQLKPYHKDFTRFQKVPAKGLGRDEILSDIRKMNELEEDRWRDGFVSGAVYHGDQEHIDFLNQVYAMTSQSNPLHSDLWPSASKFEAEIVAMAADMLCADKSNLGSHPNDAICGTVTSGGTESILLAMKTYRDRARRVKGITQPNMVVPSSVHAAFDKAAGFFGIKQIRVPVAGDYRGDAARMKKATNRNTIVIVGSAPSFPHGAIDPIEELSEYAFDRGIGFHTDACLGGFVLPWGKRLGFPVPKFDFSLRGVTSMSADTHKYGYAAKGTSVVLYRGMDLRRFQYYTVADWPGGLYFSPTFAGSRPGALSAACWAAMLSMGQDGYLQATKKILETAGEIKKEIIQIPELTLMGDPLWVLAFRSEVLDVYRVMDFMTKKNWNLNGLHKPAAVHLCVTLRHTEAGVAERFIEDLREAVDFVKNNPDDKKGMAPIYGLAASLPFRTEVSELLNRFMDMLYKA